MADREQGFKSDLVIQFVLSGRGTQGHQKNRQKNNQEFCFLMIKKLQYSFKPKKLQTETFIA